ncbi:YajQ family cyclic di-GMP-binding protein [Psychrobium sp. 1_MG-2023]|uniref:YajQ family cyclic di-GMP-binding protein n=1 Tax=Psychrobium sp. 1_MG-2023 TaxID=3062624 RepID=UPI000C3315E8|nr:YajQ family cyclic di-GMP-binding protein [Psychrobium sp. 1_MG-2023]MDP2560034.1 YajQ family cyclic di-GMP-binding protein [Psychrobium sp. 1_MG-2023]PKF56304.1 YajQ family cyclic di-GMP-binding protein [Alteromonadales bacterium alter-6D02]
MPSFDVVSEIEITEVRNAVENSTRELATRFDFRGKDASFSLSGEVVTLKAEDDFQINQMLDILRSNLVRRNVDTKAMEPDEKPLHTGKTFSLNVKFKQGIDALVAKSLVKKIKSSKLKVQTAIQGEKLRITGKKRDELQATMALIREAELDQPFQFENFRD